MSSGTFSISVLPRSFVPATGVAHLLECRPLPFELPQINVAMLWHRRHEHDSAQHWLRAALVRTASHVAQGLPLATP